jgi:hypothetical protein
LTPELILRQEERDALYNELPGPKRRHITGCDGQPMFHHYSWVRTKDEMLKKVSAWGHKADRDWKQLVEQEFLEPFAGIDFIHGYQYKKTDSLFDIRLESPTFVPVAKEPRVTRLTQKHLLDLLKFKKPGWWGWMSGLVGG